MTEKDQPAFKYDTIKNITARCEDCERYSATGSVTYEVESEAVCQGGVIEKCRAHHNSQRGKRPIGSQCNRFGLYDPTGKK